MTSWIPSSVIYQVNLRGLAAREPRNAIEAAAEKPDRLSPLAYVTRHLPAIARLGANVLYFLPPYPIGRLGRKGIGSPYASRDFRAIEPEYGTRAEMLALVRRAHRLGLKVLFDITPNHTARDHVWMTRRPDFYVRRPDGEAFHDCDWSDTAKLDYTNPALRREMIAVYDHWLGCLGRGRDGRPEGIDGFRLDMAHFINDRGFWNEALPELRARHAGRELLFLAECYGLQANLDLFGRARPTLVGGCQRIDENLKEFVDGDVLGHRQLLDGFGHVEIAHDGEGSWSLLRMFLLVGEFFIAVFRAPESAVTRGFLPPDLPGLGAASQTKTVLARSIWSYTTR